MKEFTVQKPDDGRRLDKWIKSHVPGLNNALTQKFLRLKRIKRNGKSAHADDRLEAGDVLNFYIEDEFFQPVLVNRIDRFTGGIVICAKNEESMHILSDKIRTHEIEKAYLCLTEGKMNPESGVLKGYIVKKQGKSRVTVQKTASPGAQYAETKYKVLAYDKGKALTECVLVTGRTHQIRAQFADSGHPLWGDTAYGAKPDAGRNYQALYSYKITFAFQTDAGILNYLSNKTMTVKNVPFARGFERI